MALQIVWSERADDQLYAVTSFLADSWPQQVVNEFVDKIFKATTLLSTHPEIGQKTAVRSGLRSLLVKPYTRIIYRIKSQSVVIVRLIDTRQRPS